jgi:hypothetical protein
MLPRDRAAAAGVAGTLLSGDDHANHPSGRLVSRDYICDGQIERPGEAKTIGSAAARRSH